MSVLLLGGSGFIGSAFYKEMERRRIGFSSPLRSLVDYTRLGVLSDLLKNSSFDLVINCAAYIKDGAVDNNESAKAETIKANLLFPVMLSHVCELRDVPLMQISTGCLYNDNSVRGLWTEGDPAQLTFDTGAGVYVGCKQLAEQAITYDKVWKCRVRLPFDRYDHARNYISKLMRYPKLVNFENSISHRGDFVNACLDIWQNQVPFGIYNITNAGSMWASEITEMISHHLGRRGFDWWDQKEFMDQVARTKKSNCTLSVDKLKSVGIKVRHVHDAVEESLKNWVWE